ncbi:MAG: hypothetical protein O7E49_02140, partial [Gemmatimonadetes bacterium]|nr:hypothetical protein [Gemmatimonadota bacterium]
SCRAAAIRSRAADGSTIDATWPQGRTGVVHVTGMADPAAPQFATLDGETDQSLIIAPTVFNATAANMGTTDGIGLELVRLTIFDPTLSLDPTATVTGVDDGSTTNVVSMTTAVDPAGQWIEYVPSSSGIPTVAGILAGGLDFEFPIASSVTVAANTFPAVAVLSQAGAFDITALLPAVGVSVLWYDDLSASSGDIFGNDQKFYNFTGPIDHTFVLDWNSTADVDILYADNPATAGFVCGGGATIAQPETSICVRPAGNWTFVVNLYSGTTPTVMQLMITGN